MYSFQISMLNLFQRVLDNPKTLCQSKMVVYVNRYTNETNIDELVGKLRERHVLIDFYVIDKPVGGLYSKPLYDLASRTNGRCVIIDDLGKVRFFAYFQPDCYGVRIHMARLRRKNVLVCLRR